MKKHSSTFEVWTLGIFPKLGLWNGVLLPFPAFLLSLFYPVPVACPGFAPPHPGMPHPTFKVNQALGSRLKPQQIRQNQGKSR
jgi:hypothetical protein